MLNIKKLERYIAELKSQLDQAPHAQGERWYQDRVAALADANYERARLLSNLQKTVKLP